MKLSVVSIDRQLVRVEAEGEVTMADFAADGRDPFDTILGAGWASYKVVLDCSRVTFLDSSAIGWLMTCRREFDRKGGLFLLHSIPPRVRQVLDVLRVGKALPLLANEASAMAVAAASSPAAPATKAYPAELDFAVPTPAPARTPAPAARTPAPAVPAPRVAAAPLELAPEGAAPANADPEEAPAAPAARKPRKPKAA